MSVISPTAHVSAGARLAEDVEVGPGAVIEDGVEIGSGCVIRPYAILRSGTVMGANNYVDSHAVLGGLPQDRKFDPATRTYVRIGEGNTFREFVTISRATVEGGATVIGNGTYFMTCSHAGHDARVGDGVTLANSAVLGGHSELGRNVVLGGNVSVHQFTWVGDMAMVQGEAGISSHVPPYVLVSGINDVAGLNAVGLRRSPSISEADRRQIKQAFTMYYRSTGPLAERLAALESQKQWGEAAGAFVSFIRRCHQAERPYNRGIAPHRRTARRYIGRSTPEDRP
jgi:UDP-N-acetylglucosamine acyltransferase